MKYPAFSLVLLLLFFSGCDLLDDDDDDNASDGGTEVVTTNETASSATTPTATPTTTSSTVVLNAFSDFSCTGNWSNRDGALGLNARTGNGSCEASFPGESGTYSVVLTVQTEFDGNSPYTLYINDAVAASGTYPSAPGCENDCHPDDWERQCPDKNTDLSAGTHSISTGDIIKFYGKEDWNCDEHGAYAKWHKITFTRA